MNPLRSVAGDSVAIDKALKIVEQVGLLKNVDARSINLSYGERRALEIAVALAAEPRVLFLDEPTQGMGAEGRDRLLELILGLKRKFTIVMIEHDMDFLFTLADRVSVIHWGQVIAQGTPDELRSDPWVRRAKLGETARA
jgi:branched-chain amino acid transport system ATP-binding protein